MPKRTHKAWVVLTVMIILWLSCDNSPSSPGDKVSIASPARYPEKGVVHWSSFTAWDDELIAEAARSKMVIFPIQICLSHIGDEVIGKLKSINPEIKILGYSLILSVRELYSDTAFVRQTTPYELDIYNLSRDRWAMTTTGDTLITWPGIIFINPFTEGQPDTGHVVALVDLIERYRNERKSSLDGILHDYFMYRPYINHALADAVEGEIDLDGNGILIGEDAAERDLFLQWQLDYAQEIRDRFGPDFIQVGNGRVPQENEELSGILNGIYYEFFPNMCWGITDRDGLQKLLENQEEGYLSEAFGRTWSILTNDAIEYNNYFCLISSMLAGCLYTEFHGKCTFTEWSHDLSPGKPVSDLVVEGNPDSVMTFSRNFTRGKARISFAAYGGRIETGFLENGD